MSINLDNKEMRKNQLKNSNKIGIINILLMNKKF